MGYAFRRALLLISLFLAAANAGATEGEFPARGEPKWPASRYAKSLRHFAVREKDACSNALGKIYARGGTLSSDTIRRYAEPARAHHYESGDDLVFHHYTKAEAMVDIAKKSVVLDIFDFLRNKNGGNSLGSFYVAEDPSSSDYYGPYRIDVFFREDATLLDERLFSKDFKAVGFLRDLYLELSSRFPEFSACERALSGKPWLITNDLYHLVAEDSGVDLIRYDFSTTRFYFTLNPYAIDHLKYGGRR